MCVFFLVSLFLTDDEKTGKAFYGLCRAGNRAIFELASHASSVYEDFFFEGG